jgi:hypothetical protein
LSSRAIYRHGLRGISGICGGICAATFIARGGGRGDGASLLILAQSGLKIVPADNLADAAKTIADQVKKVG